MLEKNCPIEIFADELRRRSAENQRDAQADSSALSERERVELDNLTAETLAKERGIWLEFAEQFSLGTPSPSGVENSIYLQEFGKLAYKVNNLMTSHSVSKLLDRLLLHNEIFPQTKYSLYGFTGFGNGSIYPILTQDYIQDATYATPIEIETYMAALHFDKIADGTFSNGSVIVSDLFPRNVLKDVDGDIYVVDADFKLQN